jgi:hypothetical protein
VGDILFSDGQTKKGAKRLLQKLYKTWENRILNPRCDDDIKAEPVLSKWCEQTDSYWPGLFHCYGDYRIPGTNNDIERFIKDMKQLERALSKNPNPAMRFILHAARNALLSTRPVLPDEHFLAAQSEETMREAARLLREQSRTMGIQQQVRRSPKRFGESLLKRLRLLPLSPQDQSRPARSSQAAS